MSFSHDHGYKFRKCHRVLLRNGFVVARQSGSSHRVYKRNQGETAVLSTCGVNQMLWLRYTKQFRLKDAKVC